MPQPRPLSRSLTPVPGESLPGFLLRLSYRLNLPPARLAELAGLRSAGVRGSRLPPVLVAGIPAPALPVFTRMTRLTDGQAGELGLAIWQGRCPVPAAGTATGYRRLDSRLGRSLPACCGARLDQARHGRRASTTLIALQAKILDLLRPDGPAGTLSAGLAAPPARYFADLRALALLACSTWPAARPLSPSGETASAVDEHLTALKQEADGQARVRPGTPPMDAAASGCLAHIADQILAGNPDEAGACPGRRGGRRGGAAGLRGMREGHRGPEVLARPGAGLPELL